MPSLAGTALSVSTSTALLDEFNTIVVPRPLLDTLVIDEYTDQDLKIIADENLSNTAFLSLIRTADDR